MDPLYGGYRAVPVRRPRPHPIQCRFYWGMYESAYYGPYLRRYYGPDPHAPVVHGHLSLPMQAGRVEEALRWYTIVYGAKNDRPPWKNDEVKIVYHPDAAVYTKYTLRLGPKDDGRALYFQVESREVSANDVMRDVDIWIFVQNPDRFAARAVAGGATQVNKYDLDKRYYIRLKDPFGYFWCVGKANMIPPNLAD